MRRQLLSAGLWAAAFMSAFAQNSAANKDSGSLPQIPFGQTFKEFQFPLYQNGVLNATLSAVSAKGITINRAETTDLKIDLYTNGKVTTTISSPLADLYVADRIMRTKNTVLVERADLEATAQVCDFDLFSKKYLLRQKVHVLLKNFDVGAVAKGTDPVTKPSATPGGGAPGDESAPLVPSVSPSPKIPTTTPSADIPGSVAAPANSETPASTTPATP